VEPLLDGRHPGPRLCVRIHIDNPPCTCILTLPSSSWGLAFIARGTGATALYYLSTLSTSFLARTLYVSYLAVVIAASTSATIEAFLCLLGAKKNGVIGVSTPFIFSSTHPLC
jgi:hypothetical protein